MASRTALYWESWSARKCVGCWRLAGVAALSATEATAIEAGVRQLYARVTGVFGKNLQDIVCSEVEEYQIWLCLGSRAVPVPLQGCT